MTLIKESMKFTCNRCGRDMDYEEPKLGLKWTNEKYPEDIQVCYECGKDVEEFANGKEHEKAVNTVAEFVREKYPTMKQLLKDSKKKHPFYGNHHKKVVRK